MLGRGSDVLKEVIGENHDTILVCDGWGPYKKYTIQRCNAHLVREIKMLWQKNSEHARPKQPIRRHIKRYTMMQKVYCMGHQMSESNTTGM